MNDKHLPSKPTGTNVLSAPAPETRGIPPALMLSCFVSCYVIGLWVYAAALLARALMTFDPLLGIHSTIILLILTWGFGGIVMESYLAVRLVKEMRRHNYFAVEKSYARAIRLWTSLPIRRAGRLGLAYSNLALMRLLQGKFDQAEQPLRESVRLLESDERLSKHYSMAIAVNNLAVVLVHCGELDEAEKLSKRALSIYQEKTKSTSGAAFPLINLAAICLRQKRLEQAEQHLDRAQFLLDYNKKPFLILKDSISHAKTACQLNIAYLRCEQGRIPEARDICEDLLNSEHAEHLRTSSLETIARICQHLIDNDEFGLAERILEHAYAIGRSQPDHAHTALLLDAYASLLSRTGRTDEVQDMRRWIRPVLLPAAV